MECELEKKEGAQLHAHNCIIFSMADSTVYIRDDVCEPSDIKIGNIWKKISQQKWHQIKNEGYRLFL